MAGTTSISGVVSGMDTDAIIQKLLALEQAPITRLQTRQNSLNAKLTAWQDANTRILALKSKADALATSTAFDAKSFTSGDEAILTGSASSSAQSGVYYVKVSQLARSHQIKTDGYADITTTTVGTGTVSITVGTGAPKEITIDSTNNTLTGLRDAINNANAGVKAAIISDGTGTNPYHLVITSSTGGEAGEITIGNTLTGGTAPTFSTMQAAQNAIVTLGEGAGAITVTRGSNQITDLVPGVTLNLQKADDTKTITITTENDTAAVKQSIKDLVDQYNNLTDFINKQFKYDTTSNTGGTLFSDANLQMIQSDLAGKIYNSISGLGQTITALSQVGVTSTVKDGKLEIDDTALDAALADNLSSVKNLFSTIGNASSSSVIFVTAGQDTKPSPLDVNGNPIGYAINITTVATQSRITVGTAQSENLAQDETLTINGKTIELTQNMTPAEVLARINEYTSQTGVIASRTDINGQGTGNYLTFTSASYGSSPTISIKSSVSSQGAANSGIGNVTATLIDFDGEAGTGTGIAGVDIAGTINGEAATGRGQVLTGKSVTTNTDADGLVIRVTGATTGAYGTITLTKGVASLLSDYMGFITKNETGTIDSAEKAIKSQIEDIKDDITYNQERITAKQEALIAKFAAMEAALGKLKSEGDYLAGQIGSLSSGWK